VTPPKDNNKCNGYILFFMQIIVAYSVILLYNDVDINAILLARLKRIFLENKTRRKIGKNP